MACDYSKLRGKIKERFKTQDNFARALGIGRVALSQKLNGKVDFSQSEISKSVSLLEISCDDISEYFFTEKV